MADLFAYRVNDVQTAFANLPKDGTEENFRRLRYFANFIAEHVQGYTQYQNGSQIYYLFTHHTEGDYGYVLETDKTGDSGNAKNWQTPEGYNHPGGIQCAGQFLFVPCEKDKSSKVFVYDLLGENKLVKTLDFNHRAGCLGITDYQKDGKRYYLLVIGDKTTYHVYRAEITDKVVEDFSEINFSSMGNFNLEDKTFSEIKDNGKRENHKASLDCQGMGLITEATSEDVYMLAPVKEKTNQDWIYLIKLNIGGTSVTTEPKTCRHITSHGGISGVDGIHFRWGAGMRVTPGGNLVVLATARNILVKDTTSLNTNFWST